MERQSTADAVMFLSGVVLVGVLWLGNKLEKPRKEMVRGDTDKCHQNALPEPSGVAVRATNSGQASVAQPRERAVAGAQHLAIGAAAVVNAPKPPANPAEHARATR